MPEHWLGTAVANQPTCPSNHQQPHDHNHHHDHQNHQHHDRNDDHNHHLDNHDDDDGDHHRQSWNFLPVNQRQVDGHCSQLGFVAV